MTGDTPAGGMTFLAASSTLKWVGGMSGSGTCLTVTTMSIAEKVSKSLGYDLGNIAHREALLDIQRSHTVFEHRHAERAAHGDAAGLGGNRFVEAVVADAGAALFLHERARPAGAAAKAAIATAWQLDKATPDAVQHLARRVVHLVVAAEITRVVIRETVAQRRGRHLQPTRVDQLLDELAVVDDLVLATELRVFVAQRVEAVRTAGHDAFRLVLVQALDVGLGQDLVQVLVAGAAGWIADTALFFAQDREIHAGRVQDLRQRGRHLLVARVE